MSIEIVADQSLSGRSASRPVDQPEVQPLKGKSRVTNGKSHFVEHDGRGPWTRRWRDLYEQILADLGAKVSEEQRQNARRAATIAIACEKLEGEVAAGHDIDLNQYGQLTDRLGRTFRRLGLKQLPQTARSEESNFNTNMRAAEELERAKDLIDANIVSQS